MSTKPGLKAEVAFNPANPATHLGKFIVQQIGPSGFVHCHGTKCPLLTAFFSLSSFFLLSPWDTFLPEGVIVGF